MSNPLDLIQLPYCQDSYNYDPKFVIALIAAVATGAFFCRPRVTDIQFHNDKATEVEPESRLEPITSREQYLQEALQMANQHRCVLEEEVKILEAWVDYFQQHPSPYPEDDDNTELDRAICQILDQYRESGITVKELLHVLKDYFENLTKSELNKRLYAMQKQKIVSFTIENKKAPLWRL